MAEVSFGADALQRSDFATISDLIRARAAELGDRVALVDAHASLGWRAMDSAVDRIAARLQAEGVGRGHVVAIAGYNAIPYVLALFGIVRAGAAAALLTVSATDDALAATLADSGARYVFVDEEAGRRVATMAVDMIQVAFDDLPTWMAPPDARPAAVETLPSDPFNIIYSSGTTGLPKGIVQSHGMRMVHLRRGILAEMTPETTNLLSTPLYSNTTLVSFLPAVASGSRNIVMPRFNATRFCEIAAAERVTHTMLVPIQYQRIMALPDFDGFDLSAFRYKSCTSSQFSAELKADVLRRWPGRLIEVYGMTEGGASCSLDARAFPDKLHTVGRLVDGHEIRFIDEDGHEVAPGEVGEIVGRSPSMMTGYHRMPEKTRETEWYDAEGRRFIRHGDLGRFDEDGFLVLMGRRKDLIISGGFNIYPADLEAELLRNPAVVDAAVVAAPSETWGETPVGFVVLSEDAPLTGILEDANSRLGRTQRIAWLQTVEALPRNVIGKVLKNELRGRLVRP